MSASKSDASIEVSPWKKQFPVNKQSLGVLTSLQPNINERKYVFEIGENIKERLNEQERKYH